MLRTVWTSNADGSHTVRTVCTECDGTLKDADDWRRHRRNHTVERLHQSPQGRRIFTMLMDAGFKP